MFCIKCGKQIDDNSTFCNFCGAPTNNAASAAPQSAPQSAPQTTMPVQNSVPQYGAPQPMAGGAGLNLAPNVIELINVIIRGALAISALLVIIGCIGTMGTLGSIVKSALSSLFGSTSALEKTARALYNFVVMIRVWAIITFAISVAGAVFTAITKQKLKDAYVCAGIGAFVFIFHFIMFGLASAAIMAGAVAFGIIMILLSITIISLSVYTVLKNGYIKHLMKK